jgi:hypothetical protein
MSQIYNLSDLIQFINEEGEFLDELIEGPEDSLSGKPSVHTVKNVMNYSRALSVTKSELIKDIELVLN